MEYVLVWIPWWTLHYIWFSLFHGLTNSLVLIWTVFEPSNFDPFWSLAIFAIISCRRFCGIKTGVKFGAQTVYSTFFGLAPSAQAGLTDSDVHPGNMVQVAP